MYIPTVLIAGNVEAFREKIGNRPVQIVGVVSFSGKYNNKLYSVIKEQTLILNDKFTTLDELKQKVKDYKFDYLVFVDNVDFVIHSIYLAKNLLNISQIVTIDTFICSLGDSCFYSFNNEVSLHNFLHKKEVQSVFDADSFFANSQVFNKPNISRDLKIEGLRRFARREFPTLVNIYDNLYDSIDECKFRHYDVILLTAERNWTNLMQEVYNLFNMTEFFVIFIRAASPLNKIIRSDKVKNAFGFITYLSCLNGGFYTLKTRKSSDTGIYVVTHKQYSLNNLPEDYITIHAGRAISDDLGYQGDDSGQSISELNPYLNELTAMYWIWKNTSHEYVGISHYRRFFTLDESKKFSEEKILTGEQARELLKRYDIIVSMEEYHLFNLYSFLIHDVGTEIAILAINLTKTMIERYQPDYLDAFNYIIENGVLYKCNMIITRKYIYDSYCQWLFSFILEAEKEFEKLVSTKNLSTIQKRVFGFISERMLTVWLIKNRLRIKELNVMENKS